MTAIQAKRYAVIDRIVAAEVYLYIIFMFITKGEAIRNILLFSAFLLWLSTLRYRENKRILTGRIPLFFWAFIASILISVIFSIDFSYSLVCLKREPLKSVIIFCLVSTVLSDEKRLRGLVYLSFAILVFTIYTGYYSYWVYDLPIMRPVTWIRHAWHARFATDINILLPFTLIILLETRRGWVKGLLIITIIAGISAIILSTSRGGSAAFLCMVMIWLFHLTKRHRLNYRVPLASFLAIVIFLGSMILFVPQVKEKFSRIRYDLSTFTERTEIWRPLIASAMNRPLLGWGYGAGIFISDTPFEGTPYERAPVVHDPDYRNPHNAFLRVLFHQGIVGLIAYTLLLVIAAGTFWKYAFLMHNFRGYILTACTGILISIFIVNAMLESSHLTNVSMIMGIGLAARSSDSDARDS